MGLFDAILWMWLSQNLIHTKVVWICDGSVTAVIHDYSRWVSSLLNNGPGSLTFILKEIGACIMKEIGACHCC